MRPSPIVIAWAFRLPPSAATATARRAMEKPVSYNPTISWPRAPAVAAAGFSAARAAAKAASCRAEA